MRIRQGNERGQAIALLAIVLAAVVVGVGVVVDGGYAFAQRRVSQNAADFASMAGTRIIGQDRIGAAGIGTAANVRGAIQSALTANDSVLVAAEYIDEDGFALGDVMSLSTIPSDAFGVVVSARTTWKPFLLGCLICGLSAGSLGYFAINMLWRWQVAHKWHQRKRRRQARRASGPGSESGPVPTGKLAGRDK